MLVAKRRPGEAFGVRPAATGEGSNGIERAAHRSPRAGAQACQVDEYRMAVGWKRGESDDGGHSTGGGIERFHGFYARRLKLVGHRIPVEKTHSHK